MHCKPRGRFRYGGESSIWDSDGNSLGVGGLHLHLPSRAGVTKYPWDDDFLFSGAGEARCAATWTHRTDNKRRENFQPVPFLFLIPFCLPVCRFPCNSPLLLSLLVTRGCLLHVVLFCMFTSSDSQIDWLLNSRYDKYRDVSY